MLASSEFLGHIKLTPTAPCCLRARYLQQLPRVKQNVVCTQSTKASKLQKQHAPPQQGLPFEGNKKLLPTCPNQDQQAAQDVTASDRTLSVIIRDRGGIMPKEMPSAQQRLKAVLTEDRQDAPPPGSQIREGHQVVATVIYPHDEPPTPLPRAVEAMLAQHFSSVTAAKKAIRRREVLVAGKVCTTSRVVQPGERLEWMQRVQGGKPLDASQAPANLQVVYEDEHMACIVKPQGMPTTQSGVSGRVDVRQCLPYCLRPSQQPGMLCRPQHVHRLDEATGGLLLVAKTRLGLQGLSSSFEQRQVQKSYRTVVGGRLEGRGYVDIPLDGKPSLTEYRALSQTESGNHGCISTLDLYPHTGRMHQLRRHMALVGHPMLGDPKYTYGYAKRHPDAAVLLDTHEVEQAMTPPFGVSSEHPGHQSPRARSQYAFWVSQRMTICNTTVAVRDKGSMLNATDQAQVSKSPLDIRQAGIHRLIRQKMQEDSLALSHEPHTHAWAHQTPDSEHSQRPDAQHEHIGNVDGDEQQVGCSQTSRLGIADDLSYGRNRSNAPAGREVPAPYAPQHRQTSCCSKGSGLSSAATVGSAVQDTASDCQSDSEAMPSLLERPQHAKRASLSPAAPAVAVVDERLIAAAPTYARTVMLQQQQELAGFSSHAQLPMPFSHLLCLWAIKLVLPHPVTQKVLKVTIPDPPVFEQVRAAEARLVSGASNR
ncbi:hypothetical protein WJX77_010589 [Trebouxia sp. C0004]